MSKIKKYKLFLESNSSKDINIYEFSNMLKGWNTYPSYDDLKRYSNRFIGEGIYTRVNKLVDDMFSAFSKIDLDWIKICLDDFFDDYVEFERSIDLAIVSKDPRTLKANDDYNSISCLDENYIKSKKRIICKILLDMVHPTLSTYGYNSKQIRTTEEQIMVSDPKWNCVNFDIENYMELDDSMKFYTKMYKYNIEDFFNCYNPAIYIEVRSHDYQSLINLKKLEDSLDRSLYRLLKAIDYEKVLYDIPKEGRRIDDKETNVMDYNVKILLK